MILIIGYARNTDIMKNNNEGFSIFELLISIPINIMLLAGGIMLIYNAVHAYVYSISDLELIEEVRQTAQRIDDSLRYCCDKDVKKNILKVYVKDISASEIKEITYLMHNNGIVYCNNQPITGETMLGNIEIQRLQFDDNNDDTVHVFVEGVNLINGHRFSVENNVLCYAKFIENGKENIISE